MPNYPELPEMLALHIRAASRPGAESQRLLRVLTTALWPGGPADRTDRVARGWLRMWGPVPVEVDQPHCGCAHGLCAICN
jgi:hypothetical protein